MKITVIISTHNIEKYIDDFLCQLERQTCKDFDVLIVDDCSADNTVPIIKSHIERDIIPIRLISPPSNLGKGGLSRNFALDSNLITGEYVVFFDGDDSIELNYMEKMLTAMETNRADIVLCSYDRFEDDTGNILCREMTGFPPVLDFPRDDDIAVFINSAFWNKMLRTDLIKDNRMPDISVGEDLCFFWNILGECKKIVCLSDCLIHYRVHAGSCISNTKESAIDDLSREMQILLNKYGDRSDMLDSVYLATFVHVGISMAMRAYDNKDIDIRAFLKKNKAFLKSAGIFDSKKFLSLRSLKKHGIKGFAIWVCKVMYTLSCMRIFLWAYNMFKHIFKSDIKF